MINIVFLLLIFFMLAGALRTADFYEIDPLTSQSEAAAGPMSAVVLVDRQGRLAFEGAAIDEEELKSAVAAQVARTAGLTLQLKADGGVSTARVVQLIELLRSAGVERLLLLTLEPES